MPHLGIYWDITQQGAKGSCWLLGAVGCCTVKGPGAGQMERPHTVKASGKESRPDPGRQSPSSSGVPAVPSFDVQNIMPDGKRKIVTGSRPIFVEWVGKGGFRTDRQQIDN